MGINWYVNQQTTLNNRQSAPVISLLINDSFSDANSTLLTNHLIFPANIPSTTWEKISGTDTTIQSNKAFNSGTASIYTVADSGINNGGIIVDINYVSNASVASGLIARLSDANNFWLLSYTQTQLTIYKMQSGSATLQASTNHNLINGTTYRLIVTLKNQYIKMDIGKLYIQTSNTFNQVARKHGIRLNAANVTNLTADNFQIYNDARMLVGFGDSTTTGEGATTTTLRWLDILANSKSWFPINSGITTTVLQNTTQNSVAVIGGAATNNGRDTISARVTQWSPYAVCILYGLNDLRLNDAAFSDTLYSNDLGEVIDTIVAAGTPASRIAIGTPPYIDPTKYTVGSPYDGGSIVKHEAYANAALAVAASRGTKSVDVYRYMRDNGGNSLMSADGIHPNDAGYAIIANLFAGVL